MPYPAVLIPILRFVNNWYRTATAVIAQMSLRTDCPFCVESLMCESETTMHSLLSENTSNFDSSNVQPVDPTFCNSGVGRNERLYYKISHIRFFGW